MLAQLRLLSRAPSEAVWQWPTIRLVSQARRACRLSQTIFQQVRSWRVVTLLAIVSAMLTEGESNESCLGIQTGFHRKSHGCEARATLGHRPPNIANRNAVADYPFQPTRLTSATTRWRANLGLVEALGFSELGK